MPRIANSIFILSITLHRLLFFTFTFRAVTERTARIFSDCIWAAEVLLVAILLGCYRPDGVFHSGIGICVSSLLTKAQTSVMVVTGLTILLPLALITITNLAICFIATKHSTGIRKTVNNMLLICLVSGVFISSWIPYINISSETS